MEPVDCAETVDMNYSPYFLTGAARIYLKYIGQVTAVPSYAPLMSVAKRFPIYDFAYYCPSSTYILVGGWMHVRVYLLYSRETRTISLGW